MIDDLLHNLKQAHMHTVQVVSGLQDEECRRQYHPDLSPLSWHAAHMAFIESYWVQEVVLANSRYTEPLKTLYFPECYPKMKRSQMVPPREEVLTYIKEEQNRNFDSLGNLCTRAHAHPLLKNGYLLRFLVQHYHQHLETIQQILQQRALTRSWPEPKTPSDLAPVEPQRPDYLFAGGQVEIGNDGSTDAYDNELQRHSVEIPSFTLSSRPVTNAEYLGFMQKQGYRTRRYWSDVGWNWLMQVAPPAPHHWRQDATGSWYALTPGGAKAIIGSATVYGVSYYEAQAYAAYAGCRLPTEIEWEHAVTSDQAIDDSRGQAWEWCSNTFYAYPGFKPFPYDRYSCPWFDDNHYTMRGGSLYTSEFLKRPTFRNFYTPEKRHIFAGIRLAGK